MTQSTSPTILIVDDEPDLRQAISFDFKRKNFHVLSACSGNQALQLLAKEKVDIVLTDVRMPDGTGIELLEKIKAQNVFLPVVMFITAYSDISLEEAYDKGVDAVFAKPFDRTALFDAVMRAIQPIEMKFSRKMPRVDMTLPIGVKFMKSGFTVQSKIKNLGRGGLFVELAERLPELENVEFFLESETEPGLTVQGTGLVRWVRAETQDDFPRGCGIEFTDLNQDCVVKIVEMINFAKTKSYIPRK